VRQDEQITSLIVSLIKCSEHRFWDKVEIGPSESCWKYKEFRDSEGYGRFRVTGLDTKFGAHVCAFIFANGFAPELVRHSCDNPPCCNPAHLLAGTHQLNSADMVRRNRSLFGERNSHAKLTEAEVREILADTISTNKALAAEYGVTHSMISCIRLRKSWRHVS